MSWYFLNMGKRDLKLRELICDGGYANSFRRDDFISLVVSHNWGVFLLQADSDLLKKANTVSKEISEKLLSIILFSQV